MDDREIKLLLKGGSSSTFSLDPQHRAEIVRSGIDAAVRETRRHLAAKHKVVLVVVRER